MCSPTLTAYPRRVATLVGVALLLTPGLVLAGRTTLSLDGAWRIADSTSATEMPAAFPTTVPVPGLANLAKPGFRDVDKFISRENLANRIRSKLSPDEWLTNYWKGKVEQDRDYFWYQKTFRAPAPRALAQLRIAKAQFGTAVWLNGRKVGEYAGCFTAGYFKLNGAIGGMPRTRWSSAWRASGCVARQLSGSDSRRSNGRPASTTACR